MEGVCHALDGRPVGAQTIVVAAQAAQDVVDDVHGAREEFLAAFDQRGVVQHLQ